MRRDQSIATQSWSPSYDDVEHASSVLQYFSVFSYCIDSPLDVLFWPIPAIPVSSTILDSNVIRGC